VTSRARSTAWIAPLLGAAVSLSACTPRDVGEAGPPPPSDTSVVLSQLAADGPEDVPAALDGLTGPGLPEPLVDPADIVDGGAPPDGIPPLDHPRFERTGDVDWLDDDEQVLALRVGEEMRAYPVQIMLFHEIVNDTVGGVPVAVTYCPLCNSALAYDRRAAGRVLSFGTSGKLYFSDLVMYDRQTRSLWPQIEGRAVAGVLTGTELDAHPVATISWQQWKESAPDGWVLSRRTGFNRGYGINPYVQEDDRATWPGMYWGPVDNRMALMKQPVIGIRSDTDDLAVDADLVRRQRVLPTTVGGEEVVLWWEPGARSSLERLHVGEGRDVGTTGVFWPVVRGQSLHFRPGPEGFVDAETGSTWDVLGVAVDGPLAGERLRPVQHVSTFWFAWAAYRPDTRVHTD
jgi:hypothetical protein